MPEYVYECICHYIPNHNHLCKRYNYWREEDFKRNWELTGIARHWREVEEAEKQQ